MDLKGSKTEKNLLKSFAGESQARNRYAFFASVAKTEGFEQISALFIETAENEKEHASNIFKSINEFNIDRPFNQEYLRGVIYHEYEHHVSNLWREKAFKDEGFLELSIVPLHTGRCIISEGTADTAKEFLGVVDDNPRAKAFQALYELRRMVSINSAILMNAEGGTIEEAIDYSSERGLRDRNSARGSSDFTRPVTKSGKPNLWAPYVFTYYIGRFRYVLPTYERAIEQDQIDRFFNTVYVNPFSCSSLTWEKAFSWL